MRIIILDDNRLVVKALTESLKVCGHEAVGFERAETMISHLESTPVPDLIVIDFRLESDQTGWDIAVDIRAGRCKEVPIILITGYADLELATKVQDAQKISLIKKPFSVDALLQSIY